MFGYICIYCGKRFEVYANSLSQARELAIAHFRPAKSKLGLLSIVLAETDGKPVSHSTSF